MFFWNEIIYGLCEIYIVHINFEGEYTPSMLILIAFLAVSAQRQKPCCSCSLNSFTITSTRVEPAGVFRYCRPCQHSVE